VSVAPRLPSVDALRGLTVAAMVLVNNPGTWSAVYPPLRHAEWHGFTPTDMIFPFFLFIVGVAIPLALGPRLEAGAGGLVARVVRRSAVIFALGLLLHAQPFFQLSTLRIPGVLQRIGAHDIANQIVGSNRQRRIIFPFVGIANFGGKLGQLVQGSLFGLVAHPSERADAALIRHQ